MTDNPERVGFEAYFETDEFLADVKKFVNGIEEIRNSISGIQRSVDQMNTVDMGTFGLMGQDLTKMTDEVAGAFGVIAPLMEQKSAEVGKKAGSVIGDQLIVGLLGATIGSGNMKAAAGAIGAVLGNIIGNAIAPGIGGAIGSIFGASIGKNIDKIPFIFLGPIGKAIKLFDNLKNAAEKSFNVIARVGKAAFSVIAFSINTVATVAKTAFSAIKMILSPLQKLATLAKNVFVSIFRNIATSAFEQIKTSLSEMFESVKEFQSMQTGMNSLVRSALVLGGEFETASDAIAASVPIANRLKDALIDIAMNSPFSMEYIYQIYRTNTAFGIALDTSLALTEAVSNIGAATGFSQSVLERIARNFAQIARNGKIFQRDIYELANAGLDLVAILDTELGVSVDEFNQKVQNGELSVNSLIDALISFSEKNYGQAAEDLSNTLIGLENRLNTIKMLATSEFMEPITEQIVNGMQILVAAFAAVTETGVFESLGDTVAYTMQRISGQVDFTVDDVSQAIMKFILWIVDIANTMFEYGFGMMDAWGQGMIEGAIAAINAVADLIASAITILFSTHSPPKILPMIDVWGAETIEAWLTGMTEADFGIINAVISPIEQALQNMGFDQRGIQSSLQDVVNSLSTALQTGDTGGVLSFISDLTGPYGSAIADLTQYEFALAEAIRQVEEAQTALNEATQLYEDTDTAIQQMVRDYNELLRAGADDEVLDAKLSEIQALQEQRDEAAGLIDQREQELDLAEENQNQAQDMLDAQQEMVNLMLRLTRSIQDTTSSLGELGGEFEGLSGGVGSLLDELDGLDNLETPLDKLKDDIDNALQGLRDNIDELVRRVTGFFNDEDGSFQNMIDNLQVVADLIGRINGFSATTITTWDNVKGAVSNIAMWLEVAWGYVTRMWESLGNLYQSFVEIKDSALETRDNVAELALSVAEFLIEANPLFATFKKNWGLLSRIIDTINDDSLGFFDTIGQILSDTIATEFEGFIDYWGTLWENIKRVQEKVNDTRDSLTTFVDNIINLPGKVMSTIGDMRSGFSGIANALHNAYLWLQQMIRALLNLVIPEWLQTHSPPPLEVGLRGIGDALKELNTSELPQFKHNLDMLSRPEINFRATPTSSYVPAAISNRSITNNFNMGNNTVRSDMDLAILENQQKKMFRQATFGV